MTELDSLLVLSGIPGLGSIRIKKLLQFFGSAQKALSADFRELSTKGVLPAAVAKAVGTFDKEGFLKTEWELIKKHNASVITLADRNYPENLRHISDCPPVLYIKGHMPKENKLAVAVVGSRRASFYGLSMAEKFARELAELNITIVSGMALGIDTAAHAGALKVKGKTIAVLGSGLANIYPAENKKLFEEIVASGVVISEFPMATLPKAGHFPQRNRLISGLSLGVVVVEAGEKSGALITSRFALEQGREVFAVPGKIDSPNSFGVHRLIKEGAKLTHNVTDILEEIMPQLKNSISSEKINDSFVRNVSLNKDEENIFRFIHDEAVYVDDITAQAGAPAASVANILLNLELKHLIKQLPGKRFVRLSTRVTF